MEIPNIKSHLTTSNVYVQRQIVRDNIARLSNFKHSKYYLMLDFPRRKYVEDMLFTLTALVVKFDKKIREMEQLSFPFGGTLSNDN